VTTEVTYDNYVNYLEMQLRYLSYDSVICVAITSCMSSLCLRVYLYDAISPLSDEIFPFESDTRLQKDPDEDMLAD
jgi:hypothetical protein